MNHLEGVMVVGLTGQTGSGKTTACRKFMENGFAVINADEIARNIMKPDSVCLREVTDFFGTEILNEDKSLNRQGLADIVFNNPKKLEQLNSIMYPHITSEILSLIRVNSAEGKKLILLDAPTLFESRADDFCEIIISVLADADIREKRIISRDGLTVDQARRRMNSQLNEEFFKSHSDYIIHNNGNMDTVNGIAWEVSGKIRELFKSKQTPMSV